ncbi:hypothetical protein DITRI_Ditri06bG0078300 [Diplodiscus trichospermus]
METKHSKTEKVDQIIWSLEDELSGHAKSYTCSFCKKGFSNAQALGGHMNIHRKDRAKLREFSEENLLSLDIVKTTKNPPDHDDSQVSEIVLESSEEKSTSSLKNPCKFSGEDEIGASAIASARGKDAIEELKQLPLFVEESSTGDGGEKEEERLRLVHGSSSQIELDLELRLGPELHQDISKNTREFF